MEFLFDSNFIGYIIIFIILLAVISVFFRFVPVGLWVTAYFSGVKVGLFNLVGMRLRRVNPGDIIRPQIKATKAGLDLDINELEAHHLAGGNINDVIDALIASERANIAGDDANHAYRYSPVAEKHATILSHALPVSFADLNFLAPVLTDLVSPVL